MLQDLFQRNPVYYSSLPYRSLIATRYLNEPLITASMTEPLNNIRSAYHVLHERVLTSLRTQIGDPIRLGHVRDQAISLTQAAEQVSRQLF